MCVYTKVEERVLGPKDKKWSNPRASSNNSYIKQVKVPVPQASNEYSNPRASKVNLNARESSNNSHKASESW